MNVPDESSWVAQLGCWFHTGADAVEEALGLRAGTIVAFDTETPDTTDSFTIKCVTAAWEDGKGVTHAILLDPLRNEQHLAACRYLMGHAGPLVAHKSDFDVPGMVAGKCMALDDIAKVVDTLVYARMAWPDTLVRKRLEDLAPRLLGIHEMKGALAQAIKASGLKSAERWFREGDIHMPLYRMGAMSDTVVTLRLLPKLWEAALARQLDHPFGPRGCVTRQDAAEVIDIPQRVNRVTLRRAAIGLAVDLEYLDNYRDKVLVDKDQAERTLTAAGCRPGVGLDVVKAVEADGRLPGWWPRTKTGRLAADKTNMDRLDHPLAALHREVAHTDKVLGWMEKVHARSRVTGRLHPQWNILGASATGRMSCGEPELQQFGKEARPIIRDDGYGLHSVDWSQIEPRLLAWGARDEEFILPSEQGADLYEPISRMCGTERGTSKVVLLALMYGQGSKALARDIDTDVERAVYLQRQLRNAMPKSAAFAGKLQAIGDQHGLICTMGRRILTIPQFHGEYAGYKGTNYYCQGTNADMVYHCTLEAERRGLGDYIAIWMHDEMVCDSRVAGEIQEIMQTPPEWLVEWAGRVPVINTDSNDLGAMWQKC